MAQNGNNIEENTSTQPEMETEERPIITGKLKEHFDKQSPIVHKVYDIFKKSYGTAMKPIYISELVSGENIDIKPDNILIDNCDFVDPKFEDKQKYCSKKLYSYQKKAILKLREIELNGYIIDSTTGDKIITNAQELHLAIGAGKSICLEFLSLFYRTVPCHDIIISKSGQALPINEPLPFKNYPFFYESVCYTDGKEDETAVVVYTGYTQRKTTVWLTHQHLIPQMQRYFMEDFPILSKKTKMVFAFNLNQGVNLDADIIVVPATTEIIDRLVKMSYEQPFMRVVIDDYTSMASIDSFRQILASSTIFISGSGFERDPKTIPYSYYTLKNAPAQKLSLVGRPEETYKGIVRDNIATMKLMGSSCEFSIYDFIQKLESMCASMYHDSPNRLYPIINKEPYLRHFMTLYFVIANRDRLKNAFYNINRDYNIDGTIKNAKWENNKDEIGYYLEWRKSLEENKTNPLFEDLFKNANVNGGQPTPIVQQQCMSCRAEFIEHNGFGCVCSSCGGFFCSQCLKNMATKKIVDSKTGKTMHDKENHYCSACRKKNATYYINVTKMKDKSIFAHTLIDEFFDTTALKNHIKFDYYYYMFLNGLKPKYFDGNAIDIKYEVNQKLVPANWYKLKEVPTFQEIYAKDQILIKSLQNIMICLDQLNVDFDGMLPILLFYGCPRYIEPRIKMHFRDLCKQYPNSKINNIGIMFKENMGTLIGLHKDVVGVIEWTNPDTKDEASQLWGRLFRLASKLLPVYFYIKADTITI